MFDRNFKRDRQRSDDSVEQAPRSARTQSGDGARTRDTQVDGQVDYSHPAGDVYNDSDYSRQFQFSEVDCNRLATTPLLCTAEE